MAAALRHAGLRLLLSLLCGAAAHAASEVRAVQGTVRILRGADTLPAAKGTAVQEGDEIQSEPGGEAVIRFDDGARLAVRAGTRLQVHALQLMDAAQPQRKTLRLLQGGLRYISGKAAPRQDVRFETDKSMVGIRGTDIELAYTTERAGADAAGTYLKVNSGLATLRGDDGTQVDVSAGQMAFSGPPELMPRALGIRKPPMVRQIDAAAVFGDGRLDGLMK